MGERDDARAERKDFEMKWEESSKLAMEMQPHVDRFLPAHNLQSLADLVAALARPDRADRPAARKPPPR